MMEYYLAIIDNANEYIHYQFNYVKNKYTGEKKTGRTHKTKLLKSIKST